MPTTSAYSTGAGFVRRSEGEANGGPPLLKLLGGRLGELLDHGGKFADDLGAYLRKSCRPSTERHERLDGRAGGQPPLGNPMSGASGGGAGTCSASQAMADVRGRPGMVVALDEVAQVATISRVSPLPLMPAVSNQTMSPGRRAVPPCCRTCS